MYNMECSICMEIKNDLVELDCSHSFCNECIEKWKANSNSCPHCREKIYESLTDEEVEEEIDLEMQHIIEPAFTDADTMRHIYIADLFCFTLCFGVILFFFKWW